jgi:dTMP kinase
VQRVGRLIVLEGLDGSGKQTLTRTLCDQALAKGVTVATVAFPRYGVDVHADLVRDALYGRLGDLSDSVYGPALLFALDRRAAAPEIRELLQRNDLVLLDRYVSSNAAYGAARLGAPEEPTDFPQWVVDLEVGRFGLPLPDRQLLLATSVELSAQRARSRAESDTGRALDRFEADGGLQSRTGAMYRLLAEQSFLSPWTVLTPGTDPADVLEQLLRG